jgi:acylphosphatase
MARAGDAQHVRKRVIFAGHVQGVCFRATAHELSQRHAVVGYVRNLPDGTVELEAEGTPVVVEAFLADVARHFARNITDTTHATVPMRGDESAFDIRY